MQPNRLRTAATLAIVLPALVTGASAQQRREAAPAARPAASAPAPRISAPAPPPHIAAPAPPPHFSAPAARIAAPTPRIATPHIAVQTHAAPPVHLAAPHITSPQIERRNIERPTVAHQNNTPATRRIETNTGLAHRGTPSTPNNATSTKLAAPNPGRPGKSEPGTNASKLANKPNIVNPNAAAAGRNVPGKTLPANAPTVAGQGLRGRNVASQQAHEQARSQIYANNRKPVLRNQTFIDLAHRDPAMRSLARSTFQGRFAQFHPRDRFADRRGFRGIVIGWVGPVFWPYAYYDFVDYTFWPYADDTFWPYAYDDVYDGLFGAYAPDSSAYASVSRSRRQETARGLAAAGLPAAGSGAAQICSGQASGLTDWPIEQIAQQVGPDDMQRTLLDQLRDATAKAVNLLQGACPTDLPSTPTGRLAEMRQRVSSMLQAVQLVRPALDQFYASLNDEQKERFNELDGQSAATSRRARASGQPDLTQVCSSKAAQVTNLPVSQITQALALDEDQRAALSALDDASTQASDLMSQNCAQDQSLTPTGRVAAIEQRLSTMLQALDTVQPALASFYGTLSDEQKARFNRLPRKA